MNQPTRLLRRAALAVLGWLALTTAQAAVVVSNLANLDEVNPVAISDMFLSTDRIGRDIGQSFTTGASGATLLSVTLDMSGDVLDGGGFTVSLYSNSGGTPGTPLATLAGDDTPATAGLYNYTAPPSTGLTAATTYWIVASVPHTAPDKAYSWNTTLDPGQTGLAGWSLGDTGARHSFLNGAPSAGWAVVGSPRFLEVNAVVPEPAAVAVATSLGLAFFAGWRRVRR